MITLPPIKEVPSDFQAIEEEIIKVLRAEIYHPLIRELQHENVSLKNAKDSALKKAIESGKVTYHRGVFSGKFNASLSKELKELGGVWDTKTKGFHLNRSMLPEDIRRSIDASASKFTRVVENITRKLSQISPAEIAGKVKTLELFDSTLWKTDRKVGQTLKAITVLPELTPETRAKIAKEWQFNLDKWIRDFTEEATVKLREEIEAHVMAGGRYEVITDTIQKSYGVSQRKAKFLARQETSLLMTKFKESRYTEAGITEYIWGTVTGTALHPVRLIKYLTEIYKWDDPPITTMPNEPVRRNNPGEDYNCFPGSTTVGMFQDVRRIYRRRYPGKLSHVVCASGSRIEATPNHPVLTQLGWKALKDLDIGDYLIKTHFDSTYVSKIDEKYVKPTIEQLFNLSCMFNGVLLSDGHAAQFHGDGTADEVNVVNINGDLSLKIDRSLAQEICEVILAETKAVLSGIDLVSDSELSPMFESLGFTPHSIMRSFHQLFSLISGKSGHSEHVCFAAASGIHTALQKATANNTTGYAVLFGNDLFTDPRSIIGDNVFASKIYSVVCLALNLSINGETPSADTLSEAVSVAFKNSSHIPEGHPLIKQFDRIIDKGVSEDHFGHYVYNLETVQGWYLAEDFAVSNCRCFAKPVVRKLTE